MSETAKSISKAEFIKGVFIEMECMCCNHKQTIGADSEEELQKMLDEEGWKDLDSDLLGATGHWCGCDYTYDY